MTRDGAVDHVDTAHVSNVDDNKDLNFAASEMEKGEYIRFMYHRPGSTDSAVLGSRPGRPDGRRPLPRPPARRALIGDPDHELQDPDRLLRERRLAVGLGAGERVGQLQRLGERPRRHPAGMYGGAIVVSKDGHDSIVPVSVTVAPTIAQDGSGNITGGLEFGGADVGSGPVQLALRQRLGVRRDRLDVACRVR